MEGQREGKEERGGGLKYHLVSQLGQLCRTDLVSQLDQPCHIRVSCVTLGSAVSH